MPTVTLTQAKADLDKFAYIALFEPVRIATEKGAVVMISEEEWESLMETVYLKGAGILDDAKEARNAPDSEFTTWNDDS
ncbi:MAG: hypothetical protein FWC44_00635 [Methanomassiliicoccaceae archaeon]|nr:hypothetical protein [Methanomassiliicoccaceae archaeon]